MAKHHNTPKEKLAQKRRTYRNQSERYLNLIEKNPACHHMKVWKKNLEHFSKVVV